MKFKTGDKVEFIYRNKKSVGEINGVYPGTQEVSIKQSDSPVDLLFSNKFIVKIEERERLVVPQCVADWYEDNKDKLDYSIWKYIRNWEYHEEDGFFNFMNDNDSKSIETLNKMRNGYEVEKEPLYYVKFIDHASAYLNVHYDNHKVVGSNGETSEYKTKFTESEIKAMDKGDAYWLLREPVEEVEGEAL
ncbi:DUF1642 domain-containing protein [Listeria monocytogenes]|nr:DUF1642 domain-containing protein [Listeria monocytogenes]EAG1696513.1 DUF1642 domain-containing protein [Listeria monocytogenes]